MKIQQKSMPYIQSTFFKTFSYKSTLLFWYVIFCTEFRPKIIDDINLKCSTPLDLFPE